MDWEEALGCMKRDVKPGCEAFAEGYEQIIRAEIARLRDAWPEAVSAKGVWCCEHTHKCKWQGFALHQGLSWGTIPGEHNEWRKWHDRECGGRLIQLVPMPPAPKEG